MASGKVFTDFQNTTGTADSIINNTLLSFSLGVGYLINDKTSLRVNYISDYYDDNAYDLLTGGVNMLAIGWRSRCNQSRGDIAAPSFRFAYSNRQPARPQVCSISAARTIARALFCVSVHSLSGTESATMPAPACTNRV